MAPHRPLPLLSILRKGLLALVDNDIAISTQRDVSGVVYAFELSAHLVEGLL